MKEKGLEEVSNPSAVFLSERPFNAPGSVVTASMEGSRPILIELQALATATSFGNPRRTILGLDHNRVSLLVAIMEKQLGMHLMGHDIFMNVAGGVKADEPALDMGIIAAVASSFSNRPVRDGLMVLGEVGLTGEVRAISHAETRVAESKKMGFTQCLLPAETRVAESKKMGFTQCLLPEGNMKRMTEIRGIEVRGIKTIADAMDMLFL